jgi:amino acid transporter
MGEASVFTAIMFIMNVVFGANTFINTKILIDSAGGLSWLVYVIAAIVMFPLIISCAFLSEKFSGYSMYKLISTLDERLGATVSLAFSFCKIISATIVFIFSIKFLSEFFNLKDFFIIFVFSFLTIFFIGMISEYSLKSFVQRLIAAAKFLPVLLVVFFSFFYLFKSRFFNISSGVENGYFGLELISLVPIVILSFSGFESIFAILKDLKDKKRAVKIILISFFFVSAVYFLYQFFMSNILSKEDLIEAKSFSKIYNLILCKFEFSNYLISFLNIAIGLAVLGGSYNMFFANSRNIFMVFKENKKFSNIRYSTIISCLFIIISLLIFIFENRVILVQQINALATITIYCCIAFLYIKSFSGTIKHNIMSGLVLISLLFLLSAVIYSTKSFGIGGYIIYFVILSASFLFSKLFLYRN